MLFESLNFSYSSYSWTARLGYLSKLVAIRHHCFVWLTGNTRFQGNSRVSDYHLSVFMTWHAEKSNVGYLKAAGSSFHWIASAIKNPFLLAKYSSSQKGEHFIKIRRRMAVGKGTPTCWIGKISLTVIQKWSLWLISHYIIKRFFHCIVSVRVTFSDNYFCWKEMWNEEGSYQVCNTADIRRSWSSNGFWLLLATFSSICFFGSTVIVRGDLLLGIDLSLNEIITILW